MLYELDTKTRKLLKRLQKEGKLDDREILELFDSRFPDEKACLSYVLDLRWGRNRKKFMCPNCEGDECKETSNALFRCSRCHSFVSVKVGTLFQDSKLRLRQWFMAMWFMAYRNWGLSSSELQGLLGIKNYRIALALSHKLRRAMSGESSKPLRGKVVQLVKVPVKLGRTTAWVLVIHQDGYHVRYENKDKSPKVTKTVYERDYPPFVRLRHLACEHVPLLPLVTHLVKRNITVWTQEELTDEPWSRIYDHREDRLGSDNHSSLLAQVRSVDLQLRKWLSTNYHSHVKASYLQNYLDEFVFWYNRQFIYSGYHDQFLPTYRWIVFDQLLRRVIQTNPFVKNDAKSQE